MGSKQTLLNSNLESSEDLIENQDEDLSNRADGHDEEPSDGADDESSDGDKVLLNSVAEIVHEQKNSFDYGHAVKLLNITIGNTSGKGMSNTLTPQENATSLEDDKLSNTLIPQENAASLEDAKKDGGGTATTSATSFVAMATPKAVTWTHKNIAAGQKASSMTITEGTGLSDKFISQVSATSPEDDKKDGPEEDKKAGGGTVTTLATSFVDMVAPKAVTSTRRNIAAGQKASSMTITEGTGLSNKFISQVSATSPEDDKKDGPEEDKKAGGGTVTTLATSFVDTVAPKVVTSTRHNIAAGQKASGKAYTRTAVMQPNSKTRALLNAAKAGGDTESDADDEKSGTSTLNDLKVMVIMQLLEKNRN
jgi:Rod binding domain-containing protein